MKKIPEGYKETELGIIPQEWEIKKLGDCVEIKSGYSPSKFILDKTGQYPFFKVDDMNYTNKLLKTSKVYFDETDYEIMKKGMVVFPKRGASIFTNKVAILEVDCFFDTNIMGLTVKAEILFEEFLFYKLKDIGLEKFADTTAIPQINNKHILPLIIALPSLTEQQKIAEILSSVDDHIERLDETISEYELLKKGMMKKLLTEGIGHTEFKDTEIGKIPKEWEVRKVKEICNISTGKKNTQDKKDEGIYPFFVRSDKIEKINSFSYDGEAVLTAGDGVGTGKVFHYINGKFDVHQRVYKMTEFREIQGYFFYLYFSQNFYDRVKRMSAKTSVDSVRMDMISEMDIAVPHENEQKEISQIIYLMTERIDLFKSEKEDFVKVKKGLMEKLLTGKIRVNSLEV